MLKFNRRGIVATVLLVMVTGVAIIGQQRTKIEASTADSQYPFYYPTKGVISKIPGENIKYAERDPRLITFPEPTDRSHYYLFAPIRQDPESSCGKTKIETLWKYGEPAHIRHIQLAAAKTAAMSKKITGSQIPEDRTLGIADLSNKWGQTPFDVSYSNHEWIKNGQGPDRHPTGSHVAARRQWAIPQGEKEPMGGNMDIVYYGVGTPNSVSTAASMNRDDIMRQAYFFAAMVELEQRANLPGKRDLIKIFAVEIRKADFHKALKDLARSGDITPEIANRTISLVRDPWPSHRDHFHLRFRGLTDEELNQLNGIFNGIAKEDGYGSAIASSQNPEHKSLYSNVVPKAQARQETDDLSGCRTENT